jgi:hypothetical protein
MKNQILIMGILAIVSSLGFTAISSNAVFGQSAPQQGVPDHANPNAVFGQGASSFPPGEMGQHASSQEEPRYGIGNVQQGSNGYPVGQPVDGISKHPADLACALDPTLSLCS